MEIASIPTGAGTFFKPAEVKDAVALLVEVKKFEAQRPGNFGPKDTIIADVHVFATQEDVDAGNSTVIVGALIQNGPLVRDLVALVGKASIVKVESMFFKAIGKDGWVWRQVDAGTQAKVTAYAKAYGERLKAEMDDAPAFV